MCGYPKSEISFVSGQRAQTRATGSSHSTLARADKSEIRNSKSEIVPIGSLP